MSPHLAPVPDSAQQRDGRHRKGHRGDSGPQAGLLGCRASAPVLTTGRLSRPTGLTVKVEVESQLGFVQVGMASSRCQVAAMAVSLYTGCLALGTV